LGEGKRCISLEGLQSAGDSRGREGGETGENETRRQSRIKGKKGES